MTPNNLDNYFHYTESAYIPLVNFQEHSQNSWRDHTILYLLFALLRQPVADLQIYDLALHRCYSVPIIHSWVLIWINSKSFSCRNCWITSLFCLQAGGTSHRHNSAEQTVEACNHALGTKRVFVVNVFLMLPNLNWFFFFFLNSSLVLQKFFLFSTNLILLTLTSL